MPELLVQVYRGAGLPSATHDRSAVLPDHAGTFWLDAVLLILGASYIKVMHQDDIVCVDQQSVKSNGIMSDNHT